MSTQDPERIIAALTAPFRRDQISQRKIGGRMLDYVEGHEYITRLNEASPAWSFRMTKSETTMLNVNRWPKGGGKPEPVTLPCLTVYGELEIPGVGVRSGIGVQMIEDNAGEDVMKGALTDALKNAAKYFGLGLHMYSGDAPAPPQSRQDAPQATEGAQQVSASPTDYSDRDDWKTANRRLHAVAANVVSKNTDEAHAAIKLMAQRVKQVDSHKHMDAAALVKMTAFMESDSFDTFYEKQIQPHMPQPQQEQMT